MTIDRTGSDSTPANSIGARPGTLRLLAYPDKWAVEPNERLSFMVCAIAPEYSVELVRLRHGDENPEGPGLRFQRVPSPVDGRRRGRPQPLHLGSYVEVDLGAAPVMAPSVTLQAWIYPTTTCKHERQGVMTHWQQAPEALGYGLFIGPEGHLEFAIARGSISDAIRAPMPLSAWQWYFVAGSFSGTDGSMRLYLSGTGRWYETDPIEIEKTSLLPDLPRGREARFLLAAGRLDWDGLSGRPVARELYNGKIDSPRVFSAALSRAELVGLAEGNDPGDVRRDALLADWDLAGDSDDIPDRSGNGLHGRAVNAPMRAVTPHRWDATAGNHTGSSSQNVAIHFHDDDLGDAGWDPDFSLDVPGDLPSGVYAARLSDESSDIFIPFFVRPSKSATKKPLALLLPTLTYMAYGNDRVPDEELGGAGHGRQIERDSLDVHLADHPELGLSLYDRHSDGSGCCYATRLRPILNTDPRYRDRVTHAPRLLGADLYIVDWLDEHDIAYDVLTDEDLHRQGVAAIADYRVLLTGTHPEYATNVMLDSLETFVSGGGRLMYLGANGFYWVTSIDPNRQGIIEVRRGPGTGTWRCQPGEEHHSSTGERGGLWRLRGRPPNRLAGVGFTALGYDEIPARYERTAASYEKECAFVFEGVANPTFGDFGLIMGTAAGDELDRCDYQLGSPPQTVVLASADARHRPYDLALEEQLVGAPSVTAEKLRADMVLITNDRGGAVFSVGSMSWCGSLSHNNYDNDVSQITRNVLAAFLSDWGRQ